VLAEVAEMVTGVEFETLEVVTGNVTLVCPAGTATLAGTAAAALFEDKVTVTPAEPASDNRVTVPLEEFPPITDVGLSDTLPIVPWVDGVPGLIVRLAVTVLVEVAEMTTCVGFETPVVVTVKVALV